MLKSKRSEYVAAAVLMAPFVVIYGVLFVYPTIKMVELSFTNAPLIGPGQWVGFDNYWRLATERLFPTAVWNTIYFVLLSALPSTLLALVVALGVNRLKGWVQSAGARRLLPALYPAGVGRLAHLELDVRQGFRHRAICDRPAQRRTASLDLPHHTLVHADGRSGDHLVAVGVQRAAVRRRPAQHLAPRSTRPPGSTAPSRWAQFTRITWPLIWPVTVLVLTIQLILQFKIFDQVYLFTQGGYRVDTTMVMVQYIFRQAFQLNKGGLAAAASVVLFLLIIVMSVLQFSFFRARGQR